MVFNVMLNALFNASLGRKMLKWTDSVLNFKKEEVCPGYCGQISLVSMVLECIRSCNPAGDIGSRDFTSNFENGERHDEGVVAVEWDHELVPLVLDNNTDFWSEDASTVFLVCLYPSRI